jgi:hypothetical protein
MGDIMNKEEETKILEALKLVNDWSKWLITIETGAIAIIGSFFTSSSIDNITLLAKVLAIASVVFFVFSIGAAALLLLTLPEIAQNLHPNVNIWMTRDSIAGRLFRLNTQGFAILESFCFLMGILLFTAFVVTTIWLR